MPRGGPPSYTYSLPAIYLAVPGTLIVATQHNTPLEDIAATLNAAWPVNLGGTGGTTAAALLAAANRFTQTQSWNKGSDVASAATLVIGTDGNYFHVTGTTGISAIDSKDAGTRILLRFDGVLTLTHDAGALALPNGGSNIVTAAGDTAEFVSEGASVWTCVDYQRADGSPLQPAPTSATVVDTLPSYIVNGSMAMSQENGNTLGTTNGYFAADQWGLYFTAATAAMSIQRVSLRTLANAVYQLEYKCTTAKGSLGGSDNVLISQPIEGSWFQQAGFGTANAEQLVLRFQVTLPAGLYHWHFANSAANRHCAVPFTIASSEANTAVVKEIVVPPDTSGTWLTADGVIGVVADLVLAAGATVTGGTASTWGSTTYYAASTQFNILSSTANVARLADVGLRLDPDATGIYGQYEVAEVDAVYRSERYVYRRDWAANAYIATVQTPSGNTANGTIIPFPLVAMAKTTGLTVSTSAFGNFALNAGGGGSPASLTSDPTWVAAAPGTVYITSMVRPGSGLAVGGATIFVAGASGAYVMILGRLS